MTEGQANNPCGKDTRWCRCGEKPPAAHKGPFPQGRHQREHARDETGVRRGPCERPGSSCTGFDPYPCENTVTMENGCCRMHGGKSLVGVANPAFRTGEYSRLLPTKLLAHYEEAVSDANILSLRGGIAVMEAFKRELLASLRDGEVIAESVFHAAGACSTARRELLRARQTQRIDPATGQPDQTSVQRQADALGKLMDAVVMLDAAMEPAEQQKTARKEVADLEMKIRQSKRDENTRLEQLHNMLTSQQAMALQTALAMAVKELIDANVTDTALKALILRGVAARFGELARRRDD